ncbi:putative prefoldin subunit 1 [Lachnellula cervina]|uniref:Putative prefoldin subunit 1 n=1 Tax=Lachnellula cervina TaxID=1316786 RepID=A0A7D8UL49_9HELO|nr:putative prefoldin subunit 1 [Lachnellula cervina]
MSIPNEALQKLVQEIETQAIQAQQQINTVKSQIGLKQREIRMLQLTSSEVSTLPSDTPVYEGVGKMFVFSPIAEVDKRLTTETLELKTDVENLGKKLLYLETTHKNSREHIDQIFNSGGRG